MQKRDFEGIVDLMRNVVWVLADKVFIIEKALKVSFSAFLGVGMTRLELATSRPPDVCATNCATSRSVQIRVQR